MVVVLWVCGQRVCVVQAKRHIHSSRRRLDFVHTVAPHRHRRLVVHRLVRASKIVESHPGTDAGPRLAAIGIGFQMHLLVFDRAPQPLDENMSMKRPRPSIEIAMPAASSLPVKAEQAAVAQHYGLQAVWELPNPAAVSAANRFMQSNNITGITVRLAP